jgi:hypothetical protein
MTSMHWFVLLPGSLVPPAIAADLAGALAGAELIQLVAHARRGVDAVFASDFGSPHRQWLWRAFTGSDGRPLTAPYFSARVADNCQWWQCEPIHIEIERDQLRIGRSADAQLSVGDCAALAADAAEVLREHGTLHAQSDQPWLLELNEPWTLDTVDLDAARGRSVSPCLPTGPDAARWSRLQNEIQMIWHHHPATRQREALGLPTVNGLWLHGGGTGAPLPRQPFATVACTDPVLRGWALASGLAAGAMTNETDVTRAAGDAVSLWPDLLEPAAFESWSEWIECFGDIDARLSALRSRAFAAGFDSVELLLCGRATIRRISLGRRDRLRFWRRAAESKLAGLLADASSP